MSNVLFYLAAVTPTIWGISHLVPTRNVVAGFGTISQDNRLIITMEWIVEGVSMIFIGTLIASITYLNPASDISFYVYILSATALFALAGVSFLTGYNIKFLPFRMCPFVLSSSGAFIVLGLVLQS